MDKQKTYQAFIGHTRNWIFNLPESELLMPLMELRFTPEQAAFLSKFPHFPTALEQLSERFDIQEEELKKIMLPMIREGFIYEVEGKSATRYSLMDPVFFLERMPGWKGEDTAHLRKLYPLINKYYIDHQGADFMGHPTKGLRAIPIAKTIEDAKQVLPYEDVIAYVEQEEYHTVSACACRHRHNMDPAFENCKHELDVCLHFGRLGHYAVKHGMGREIKKEETLEILARCADAGLVHGISNSQKGMDTICNCCSCCCLFLEPIKLLSGMKREHHAPSNYRVEYNEKTCIACGKCAGRCPISAIELKDREKQPQPEPGKKLRPKDLKEVVYHEEICIGCGVCVHKCPTQSIKLVKREMQINTPATVVEAGQRMLMERGRDLGRLF